MTAKETEIQQIKEIREALTKAISHLDTLPDIDNADHRWIAILGATQYASEILLIAAEHDAKEAINFFRMYRSP